MQPSADRVTRVQVFGQPPTNGTGIPGFQRLLANLRRKIEDLLTLFGPEGPMECHMRSESWSIGSEPTGKLLVSTANPFNAGDNERRHTEGWVVRSADITLQLEALEKTGRIVTKLHEAYECLGILINFPVIQCA